MSEYTDSRSQPGQAPGGSDDDRELFMRNFADDVLEAWEQTYDFLNEVMDKSIPAGKSDVFPVIGRKRDATDHLPGEQILGGGIDHDEVEITLDKFTVDSVFIAEIDELMAHYDLAGPYSRQLGQSLASVTNERIGRSMVLASRVTDEPYPGGPVPSYYFDASIATDASKIETGIYAAHEYIKVNDIGGGMPTAWLPWPQYLLLSRYTGIDTEATSGSGDRAAGRAGLVGGLNPRGTNSVPRTNVTTGPTKYRGNYTTTYGVVTNRNAVGRLRRRALKIQSIPKPDRLGTLMMASQLEGYGSIRPECSFELASATR